MYYSVIVIGHQSLVPPELRNIGLKVSFINSEGKVETWEFQDGTFTDVSGWKQQVQRTEIMKLKQEDLLLEEANNTNAKFISDWGWQKGNRDYTTGVNTPKTDSIFEPFSYKIHI